MQLKLLVKIYKVNNATYQPTTMLYILQFGASGASGASASGAFGCILNFKTLQLRILGKQMEIWLV
jgi:hypothetical protein